MNILKSQLFFHYKQSQNLRMRLFDYEKILVDDFVTPFPVVRNLSDDIGERVSRFESISLNGHSRIRISPTFLNFETKYTKEFQVDSSKIQKYLENKLPTLWRIVEKEEYTHYGIVLTLYSDNKALDEVLPEIKSVFREDKMNLDDLIDLKVSYVYSLRNKYFLNVKYSPMVMEFESSDPVDDSSSEKKVEDYIGIEVVIDVNNKPSTLANEEVGSREDMLSFFKKVIENAFSNSTDSFISGSPDFTSLLERDGD
ncbi:hypothetical protein [Lewinella sp. W8]|uniref:hypothetical protein n=1 Tax=Lewinella sp. W8 TaxID=2528208 RepID=UPI0010674D4E|nr:hypothetical protein [Lewinella sp. W8]MTB53916.1 hypothetical protein [Lewinella sp. W8]